jgi:NAD(P)H dehydrogenase (quinone)
MQGGKKVLVVFA